MRIFSWILVKIQLFFLKVITFQINGFPSKRFEILFEQKLFHFLGFLVPLPIPIFNIIAVVLRLRQYIICLKMIFVSSKLSKKLNLLFKLYF